MGVIGCPSGCLSVWRLLVIPGLKFSRNLGPRNLRLVLLPGRDAAVCLSLEVKEEDGPTDFAAPQIGF